MKRPNVYEIAICSLAVAVTLASLAPAIGRAVRDRNDAKCQSNLQRWGEAMVLYLADNNDHFPSNRWRNPSGGWYSISTPIPLSQEEPLPGEITPPRFQYGLNWVEALYPYVQGLAGKSGQDWRSVRRCPNAGIALYPAQPASGDDYHWSMSYVMSCPLIEQPATIIRDPRKLMMIREFGRLTVSTLRPTNGNCVGTAAVKPMYAFLNKTDSGVAGGTARECQLHWNGTYILLADGHVQHFSLDYYPEYSAMTSANAFDPTTSQWYNYYWASPNTENQRAKNKSIAITP